MEELKAALVKRIQYDITERTSVSKALLTGMVLLNIHRYGAIATREFVLSILNGYDASNQKKYKEDISRRLDALLPIKYFYTYENGIRKGGYKVCFSADERFTDIWVNRGFMIAEVLPLHFNSNGVREVITSKNDLLFLQLVGMQWQ